MAKIPTILEAGRADGKLITSNNVYDDNQQKFLSDKLEEIDNNHNTLNNTVKSLTDTVNNNELDIENKLKAENTRATNAENNLRETINNITANPGQVSNAENVIVNTLPNSTVSNVQQALTELFKNATFAGIAIPTTNPGTPDGPVFYFANGKGIYTNFDGLEVTEDKVVILYYDTTWHKVTTCIASYEKLLELEKDVFEVIGEDITLSTTGGGSEWRRVVFNVDGNHTYTLKINDITDASNEGTRFLQIYTTTNGVRTVKYYVEHGGVISSTYFIPENTTIIEIFARFHTNETMLATLSYEGILGIIEKDINEQIRVYDESNFIVGTIYDGELVSDKTCLSNPEYIVVKPNQRIRFALGDFLTVRISEYDSKKTFIKSTGYDRFTSFILGSTTSFIRVSLNYANRGYSLENPITIEAYSTGDFRLYGSINTKVKTLQERQEELNRVLVGKQDIISAQNLYDESTAIDGYLNQNGIVIKSDVKVTDFIYCYGKKQITTNYTGRSTIYLCFYDEYKNFLSSVLQHNVLTFDIPNKAVYFRSNMSAYSSTNMIVFGDTMPEYEPYKGVDYIFSQLSKVDNLITEKEDSVISLNEDKSVALAALRNAVPNKYGYPNRNLFPLFSIATDIHSDWDRLKRVLEYSEEVGINSILCLGDIGDQQGAFDAFDWQNFVLGASIPVLTIPGNHEFVYNAGQTFYTGYTDETLEAKIYNEELVAHNGETHPNGKNYWHKDISYSVRGEDKILRIIGIYQYEFVDVWEDGHPVHTQGTKGKDMPYYKQEQIDWLVGLLDSAESNIDVVILMHHAPTNNLERVDNTWNPTQLLGINIISGVSNNTNNDFIPQIIDAWINGTTVDASSTMTNDNSVISVSHTFSSTHHGKFVGYITGHSHYDAITKIVGMDEQYVFCNTCTSFADIQQGGDLPRGTSGKLQDCFNIIAYDSINHRVGIVKIGSDVSVDMRDKKYTCNFIVTSY